MFIRLCLSDSKHMDHKYEIWVLYCYKLYSIYIAGIVFIGLFRFWSMFQSIRNVGVQEHNVN